MQSPVPSSSHQVLQSNNSTIVIFQLYFFQFKNQENYQTASHTLQIRGQSLWLVYFVMSYGFPQQSNVYNEPSKPRKITRKEPDTNVHQAVVAWQLRVLVFDMFHVVLRLIFSSVETCQLIAGKLTPTGDIYPSAQIAPHQCKTLIFS